MDKFNKAIMRAFGAKPNGSPKTSCVEDSVHVKQIAMLVTLAFTLGALTLGFKNLPQKVRAIEDKVIAIESINRSIDDRLGRIEQAILGRDYDTRF